MDYCKGRCQKKFNSVKSHAFDQQFCNRYIVNKDTEYVIPSFAYLNSQILLLITTALNNVAKYWIVNL